MTPRIECSPIPMYTTFGSDSETATAPTEEVATNPSVTGFQLMPASEVFHTPPPAVPM